MLTLILQLHYMFIILLISLSSNLFEHSLFFQACASAQVHVKSSSGKGAMLFTGHETRGKQACQELRFQDYIRLHHVSWLEFAIERLGCGVRLQDLMLVYGYHMTVDFAMFTFSDMIGEAQIAWVARFPGVTSASLAITKNSCQRVSPAVNFGPREQNTSSSTGVSVIEGTQAIENDSDNFKQCVFLKRHRIQRKWAGVGPKVIKASAGPHNLGSGDRGDGDEVAVCIEEGAEVSSDCMEIVSDTMPVREHWITWRSTVSSICETHCRPHRSVT